MSIPIGKEWNTGDSYRRLIQPELLAKAGTIIKPLRYK
jgi:U3 small nucleolar RNA-associated protein 14